MDFGWAGISATLIALCFLWWRWYRRAIAIATIYKLLSDGREWRELLLVQASGGRLSRGAVYTYLTQMEAAGTVVSRLDPGSRFGIRLYRLKER